MNTTHPTYITGKWLDRELTMDLVFAKIELYNTELKLNLNVRELTSIAWQLHKAYDRYFTGSYAGDFIPELAGDSFRRIMSVADNTNRKAVYLYHMFFYNCAPADWREKLK